MPNKVEGAVRNDCLRVDITTAANGLSGAIDMGEFRLSSIQIPSSWTTANLTLQKSEDGVNYADWYDSDGIEYVIQVGGASRSISVYYVDFVGVRFLKIRSGTSGTPVQQAATRTLLLGLAA